jgi:hypothetical protein
MNRHRIRLAWFRWIAISILAASLSSSAAELKLVSTVPADGEVSVAVGGTISLTFNLPLDTTALFTRTDGPHYLGMLLYPLDQSGRPESTTFSPDMKTVHFHDVHLSLETQYVLIVTGARSVSGDSLRTPVPVTFTTGASLPIGKIVGKVRAASGSPVNALVQLFRMTFDRTDVYACSRVDMENGEYALYRVPPGKYLALAVLDANRDGMTAPEDGDWLGVYDPDGNGIPDTVEIADYRTGVDIGLAPVPPVTARVPLSRADALALGLTPDSRMTAVISGRVDVDGRSRMWSYLYFHPVSQNWTLIMVYGNILIAGQIEQFISGTDPLPSLWLDSDTVMTLAEANGGTDFRVAHPDCKIECFLVSGLGSGIFKPSGQMSRFESGPGNIRLPRIPEGIRRAPPSVWWMVNYASETSDEEKMVIIHAVTGFVLGPTTAEYSLESAIDTVKTWSSDVVPMGVASSDSLGLDGKSDAWFQLFYSPGKDSSIMALSYWGVVMRLDAYPGHVGSSSALPHGWMDSDAAVVKSQEYGGHEFWNTHYVRSMDASLITTGPPDTTIWTINYNVLYNSMTLTVRINALTGDLISTEIKTGISENGSAAPVAFALEQNFPNPFNPETAIRYELPRSCVVRLAVLDVTGREVAVLVDGMQTAGTHTVRWNGKDRSGNIARSGLYLYKITTPSFRRIRKMLLIR